MITAVWLELFLMPARCSRLGKFLLLSNKNKLNCVFFPDLKLLLVMVKILTYFCPVIIRPILLFLKRGGNQHAVDENGEVSVAV